MSQNFSSTDKNNEFVQAHWPTFLNIILGGPHVLLTLSFWSVHPVSGWCHHLMHIVRVHFLFWKSGLRLSFKNSQGLVRLSALGLKYKHVPLTLDWLFMMALYGSNPWQRGRERRHVQKRKSPWDSLSCNSQLLLSFRPFHIRGHINKR